MKTNGRQASQVDNCVLEDDDVSYLISVRMVNLDTCEEEVLYERKHSRCHFKKWFSHKNYKIQLRLDWEDISNGEPKLDADINDKITGRLIRKGRWHHTEIEYDAQAKRKTYAFDFEGLRHRLHIIRTMGKAFTSDAILRREGEQ
jgi:hypothetical protein